MKSMLEELKDVKIKNTQLHLLNMIASLKKKRTKYLIRFIILSQII